MQRSMVSEGGETKHGPHSHILPQNRQKQVEFPAPFLSRTTATKLGVSVSLCASQRICQRAVAPSPAIFGL